MTTYAIGAVDQALGSSFISKYCVAEMHLTETLIGTGLQNHRGASVTRQTSNYSITRSIYGDFTLSVSQRAWRCKMYTVKKLPGHADRYIYVANATTATRFCKNEKVRENQQTTLVNRTTPHCRGAEMG
jgi:hypothetical protein